MNLAIDPKPVVRVGLSQPGGRIAFEIEARGQPVLVSANALFDHKKRCFRSVPMALMDVDAALDSAGFVAMSHYRRYPWSVAQYAELAFLGGFTWWSQMDVCCEPEVASNREEVRRRVEATAQLLEMCREAYWRLLEAVPDGAPFTSAPMPVIQGWEPDAYEYSAQIADQVLCGRWPDMVGVGSVCRRPLTGPNSLWRVLERLDGILPKHVTLHLFGVKGLAMAKLSEFPRVASVDSMAFEFEARMRAMKSGQPKTVEARVECMTEWVAAQAVRMAADPQQRLQFA